MAQMGAWRAKFISRFGFIQSAPKWWCELDGGARELTKCKPESLRQVGHAGSV